MNEAKQLLMGEILASDKMYGFQGAAMNITIPDDPSYVWQRIKYDPWFAQAVFQDMEEKDSMVSSCLDTRRDGVLSLPRLVLPASDSRRDKKIAEFIDETLHNYFDGNLMLTEGCRTGFDGMLDEALDAVGNGVSIGEIVFAEGRDRIYVKNVNFKPQHLFAFGDTALAAYSTSNMLYPSSGPLRLRQGIVLEGTAGDGVLPESKFFVFSYRPRFGNRWGSPQKRRVYWASWIKRTGVRSWLRYNEKGGGSVVVRYPGGAGAAEQEKALEAAQAINDEPAVAMPERMMTEVLDQVRSTGSSNSDLVDGFCNKEIARAILGQTLTSSGSDGGGSRALGEVHNEVRDEKKEADAKALMGVVNMRLVWPLVLLNFGPNVVPPTWVIQSDPEEDLDVLANRTAKLHGMGVPISKQWVFDTFQMPDPGDNPDDLLAPKAEPAGDGVEDPLDAEHVGELAEGKKKASRSRNSDRKSNSRTARFKRLRPSMIEFSNE